MVWNNICDCWVMIWMFLLLSGWLCRMIVYDLRSESDRVCCVCSNLAILQRNDEFRISRSAQVDVFVLFICDVAV